MNPNLTTIPATSCPSRSEDLPLLLTMDDLCHTLRVGRNTVCALLQTGQLKSIRIGKQYRVPRLELLRFLGEAV